MVLALSVGVSLGGYKHSISELIEKLDKVLPAVEENTARLDALSADELVKAYSAGLKRCAVRLNCKIEGGK